ncbi:MAG: hypothetical protein PHS62_03245 [Patescibacteria group bacterium]|nr:hypothetical protein [Patescibacteria group bacterium]
MERQEKSRRAKKEDRKSRGALLGVLFGILPHSFCVAFALLSIIGAVTASAFLKKFLLIPNLFLILVIISLLLATISSAIYLKKNKCLCGAGVKNKWQYLSLVYAGTIMANVLMFFVVLPAVANVNFQKTLRADTVARLRANNLSELSLKVDLPCSGHASLIIDEIKKNCKARSITFSLPNTFNISYDPEETTPEQITSLDIFKTYKATMN